MLKYFRWGSTFDPAFLEYQYKDVIAVKYDISTIVSRRSLYIYI